MRVGVVVPSRLARRPEGRTIPEFGPELWLDGALASIRNQTTYSQLTWDIYVGVSPGAEVPAHVYDHATVVRADRAGQASAVNAAADVAALSSDTLMFLEDDDRWLKNKAYVQMPLLEAYPFVSCSQRLVRADGAFLGVNDYPVPSGWVMRADVWTRVGGFNPGTRWLVDTEWLGRLNDRKVRRAHYVECGGIADPMRSRRLAFAARTSEIVRYVGDHLVDRTDNTEGGMATITRDFEAMREADAEAESIRKRFGCDPW